MKRKNWRITALLLALMLVLTSCGNNTDNNSTAGTDSTASTDDSAAATESTGIDTTDTSTGDEIVLRLADSTPETCNPQIASAALDYTRNMYISTSMYIEVYDPDLGISFYKDQNADGDPVPDESHKVWTVNLREGFTFEDGTVIDASTWEYTFQVLNDPALANRNNNLSELENGEAYLNGEAEWEDVGFKVIDDHTLEFTFEDGYEPVTVANCKEFLGWVGTCVVHPEMYESCYNADRTENSYGTTADTFVASGAYKIVDWIDGQYFEIEKWQGGSYFAEEFWKPDRIIWYEVDDTSTKIQMFDNGEIDMVTASDAAYDEYPDLYYSYTPSNYGLFLNSVSPSNPILLDKNFRYALYWGLDRESVVKAAYPTHVANAYHYPAMTTVADPDDEDNVLEYRTTEAAQAIRMDGHEITESGFDEELAQAYFEEAYEANGSEKITLTVMYVEASDTARTWAEAIQNHYQNLFGIDRLEISLQAIPSAVVYEYLNRENLEYDIVAAGGIYENIREPWSNSNWVYSGSSTYNTQYTLFSDSDAAAEYDELFYACYTGEYKFDQTAKIEAGARMEEIRYDECSFIPAYSYGQRYRIAENITPVTGTTGDPFVEFALLQADYS